MLAGLTYSITPSSVRRSSSRWNASRESPGGISLKAAAVWGGEGCMSHISEKPCLHTVIKNLSVHMWCARCDLLRTFPATGPDVVLNLSTTSGGSQTLSPCDVGCVGCSNGLTAAAFLWQCLRPVTGRGPAPHGPGRHLVGHPYLHLDPLDPRGLRRRGTGCLNWASLGCRGHDRGRGHPAGGHLYLGLGLRDPRDPRHGGLSVAKISRCVGA